MTEPAKRRKGGNPKLILTDAQRKQIEQLAGLGLKLDQIATVVGIAYGTLKNKVRLDEEVKEAFARGNVVAQVKVAKSIFSKAIAGDMTAAIWFEKTRAGRSDRTQVEHSGDPERPVVVEVSDAKSRLAERLSRAIPQPDSGDGQHPQ